MQMANIQLNKYLNQKKEKPAVLKEFILAAAAMKKFIVKELHLVII